MKKILVKTKQNKYSILIGSNLLQKLEKILFNNSIKSLNYLMVVDSKVPKKFIVDIKKNFRSNFFILNFKSSEKNKSFSQVNSILNVLQKNNFNRNDCVIAIGGGIVGDVASFAASLFKRGLYFVNIPTTLLAQVDSSIGGKTGINTKFGKNLIGTFYQPNLVISDINFLKSLSKREILCGYGEILKHFIIKNRKLFIFLSKNFKNIINLKSPFIEKAIFESCLIKKKIVEKDENEKNLRKLLNFGHTFGHAYEGALGFSKRLNHGEAVIMGIKSAAEFSLKKKLLNNKDFLLIKNHIDGLNNILTLNNFFKKKDISRIIYFMKSDKKNIDKKINLILIKKIGKIKIENFYQTSDIRKFLSNQISST